MQFGPPQQVFAGVAQRLEQVLHKDKATGSIPVTGIWSRGVAWFNMLPCHGRDHGFKSRRDRKLIGLEEGLPSLLIKRSLAP